MRSIPALRPAALLAAALLVFFSVLPLHAQDKPQDKPMDRLITVSATGHVSAAPDQARISSGVTAEADTASDALSANTELMKKVVEALKGAGIESKDIQTSNFNVEPRYTHPRDNAPPVINGYRVSNQVTVLVRDLASLGGLVDTLVKSGANQVHGLSFEVSKDETLKDEARKEAVANARRRAELLAGAAGAEVGEVVSIAEDVSYGGPRPMAMARAMKAEAAQIEAGTETLEARVTITWKLK